VSKNSAERSISFPSLRPAESPFPSYRPSSRGWANTSATVQRGNRWIEERMEERKREREETEAAWKGCTNGFWGWRQRGVLIEWLSRRDQRHFRTTRYTRARVRVYMYARVDAYVATDRRALYIQSASRKTSHVS